jgi:hypothetical protein
MKAASMCTLPSLIAVALLACEPEPTELPSEPSAGISANRSRAHGPPSSASTNLDDDEYERRRRFSDWSAPVNLGPIVNSPVTDIEVSISRDDRSLYVASNRPGGFGGFDIWVSQRANAKDAWGTLQNLGPTINSAFNEQGPSVSLDGQDIYFFSNRDGGLGGNDLYTSSRSDRQDDFGWRAPTNLGSGVNSAANEGQPVIYRNQRTGAVTLYFNSNRPGGPGVTDIYLSVQQPDGTFGAVVVAPELNSPLRDVPVAVRRDGLEMFLTSDRIGSMGVAGSFDLWVTTRASTSDPWGAPVNLGSVVNTEGGESRGALSFDATTLYLISDRPGGSGNLDLWVSTRSKLGNDDTDGDDQRHRTASDRR